MLTAAAVIVGSYLIGSVPVAYIAGRTRGIDIRNYGSGNVGASNVWQSRVARARRPRRSGADRAGRRRHPHREGGGPAGERADRCRPRGHRCAQLEPLAALYRRPRHRTGDRLHGRPFAARARSLHRRRARRGRASCRAAGRHRRRRRGAAWRRRSPASRARRCSASRFSVSPCCSNASSRTNRPTGGYPRPQVWLTRLIYDRDDPDRERWVRRNLQASLRR